MKENLKKQIILTTFPQLNHAYHRSQYNKYLFSVFGNQFNPAKIGQGHWLFQLNQKKAKVNFILNSKTPDISTKGLAASQDVSDFTPSVANLNIPNRLSGILLLVMSKVNTNLVISKVNINE